MVRHKVWVPHSHHSTDPQDLNGQLDQMEEKNQLTEEQLNTLREELVGVRGRRERDGEEGEMWGGGGRGVGRRERCGEEGEVWGGGERCGEEGEVWGGGRGVGRRERCGEEGESNTGEMIVT